MSLRQSRDCEREETQTEARTEIVTATEIEPDYMLGTDPSLAVNTTIRMATAVQSHPCD